MGIWVHAATLAIPAARVEIAPPEFEVAVTSGAWITALAVLQVIGASAASGMVPHWKRITARPSR